MRDVARLAGVSTASVSRVLNSDKWVSAQLAARVREAAASLGYEPDAVARSLRRRETATVGLVVADIANPYFGALVRSLEQELRAAGLVALLYDAREDVGVERSGVDTLLARRVDGMIMTPCDRRLSREAVLAAAAQVPTVQVDRRASREAHYVGMDHERAIRDVLDHLSAAGRRCPVLLASDPRVSSSHRRQVAFDRRTRNRGERIPARALTGSFSMAWGTAGTVEALSRWPDTDALVCADDLIALGALDVLARRGVRVPEDVAVAGFDDTPFATVARPELTSVRQPITDMAQETVRLLSRSSPDAVVCLELEGELRVRGSTTREAG
jgi:LacI family transcriptional regulator